MLGLVRLRKEVITPAALARLDHRQRQAVFSALGAVIPDLTHTEVSYLFHLGFSEYPATN
jgi:hypothetical protein